MKLNLLQMAPLMAISVIVYAVLTLAGTAVGETPWYLASIVTLPLASGEIWQVRGGDVFLVSSMGLLFVELIRATRSDTSAITNHMLSFLLFLACLLLFLFVRGFGNSFFFLLMSMTFLDPMAGIVVTTNASRRDVSLIDR